LNSTIGADKV